MTARRRRRARVDDVAVVFDPTLVEGDARVAAFTALMAELDARGHGRGTGRSWLIAARASVPSRPRKVCASTRGAARTIRGPGPRARPLSAAGESEARCARRARARASVQAPDLDAERRPAWQVVRAGRRNRSARFASACRRVDRARGGRARTRAERRCRRASSRERARKGRAPAHGAVGAPTIALARSDATYLPSRTRARKSPATARVRPGGSARARGQLRPLAPRPRRCSSATGADERRPRAAAAASAPCGRGHRNGGHRVSLRRS